MSASPFVFDVPALEFDPLELAFDLPEMVFEPLDLAIDAEALLAEIQQGEQALLAEVLAFDAGALIAEVQRRDQALIAEVLAFDAEALLAEFTGQAEPAHPPSAPRKRARRTRRGAR